MVTNYRNATGIMPEFSDSDGNTYVYVYNDTGAAISNGDVYMLGYAADADSLSPSAFNTLDACATTAIYRQMVVVNNLPLGKTTIADQEYGYVQKKGYIPKVKVAATIAIGDYIQGANASQEAADDGTTITTDSFGVAVTAVASNYCEAILFGERSLIG